MEKKIKIKGKPFPIHFAKIILQVVDILLMCILGHCFYRKMLVIII
jgi:hypothetical protein